MRPNSVNFRIWSPTLKTAGTYHYVVPLLVSSYSEVARQWKFLLGVDVQPGFTNNPLFPVQKRASIHFFDPLDDSAVVVEILLDRAHESAPIHQRERYHRGAWAE